MTTRALIRKLARHLKVDKTADLTLTVSSATVSNVTVQEDITGGPWDFGVLEVQDGNAEYADAIIGSVTGKTLFLAENFDMETIPRAGDKIKLTMGPLAGAKINQFDPDSTASDRSAEITRPTITIYIPDQDSVQRTLGGDRRDKAKGTKERGFGVLLVLECPDMRGKTQEETYRLQTAIDFLLEQVTAKIYFFRAKMIEATYGVNKIVSKKGFMQREAGKIGSLAATIEFDLRKRK